MTASTPQTQAGYQCLTCDAWHGWTEHSFALAYCRISKDDEKSGLGVNRQKREMVDFARQLGMHLAEVYADNAKSATKGLAGKAPDYDRMLADLTRLRPAALLSRERERLYRDLTDYAAIGKLTNSLNIAVYARSTGDRAIQFDTIGEDIQAVIARNYTRNNKINMLAAHDELRSKGLPVSGGIRPFGYSGGRKSAKGGSDGFGMAVVKKEAAALRDAAKRILAGESAMSVCRRLNDYVSEADQARVFGLRLGSRSLRQTNGGIWKVDALRQVLTSARVAGKLEHDGRIIRKAAWPAILDEPTWLAVREHYANKPKRTGRPALSLLGGILRCGACGAPMVQTRATARKGTEPRKIYRCDRNRDGCGKVSRNVGWLDALVTQSALNFRWQELADDQGEVAETAGAAVDTLSSELAELDRRRTALRERWAAGQLGDEDYFPSLDSLQRRRTVLTREIASAKTTQEKALSESEAQDMSADQWSGMTVEERRFYIRECWASIIVQPRSAKGPLTDFDMLDIDFRPHR
jgi:hypothetical protein